MESRLFKVKENFVNYSVKDNSCYSDGNRLSPLELYNIIVRVQNNEEGYIATDYFKKYYKELGLGFLYDVIIPTMNGGKILYFKGIQVFDIKHCLGSWDEFKYLLDPTIGTFWAATGTIIALNKLFNDKRFDHLLYGSEVLIPGQVDPRSEFYRCILKCIHTMKGRLLQEGGMGRFPWVKGRDYTITPQLDYSMVSRSIRNYATPSSLYNAGCIIAREFKGRENYWAGAFKRIN